MRSTTRQGTTRQGMNGSVLAAAMATSLALAACGQMDGSANGDEVAQTGEAITTAQLTQVYTNGAGSHQTALVLPASNANGTAFDSTNEFFQSLGTNGRSCGSCHQPAQAWGINPVEVQQRFNATNGTDPIFRLNDGANSPKAPVATLQDRQAAYSLLRTRGVIRVGLPIPANAEFDLVFTEDPYKFASAAELSLFRRPLPSTNLKFLATVMWDGRESVPGAAVRSNLLTQSNDATRGHAEGAVDLTPAQRDHIVDFENALFTAQITDRAAGDLRLLGGRGGPVNVSTQDFHIGINDVLGADPAAPGVFNKNAFNIYDAWASPQSGTGAAARASIARGQNIFNTHVINIAGVRGVNDALFNGDLTHVLVGTCTTCHDAPNAGDHSVALPLDLGLTDPDKFNTDTTPRYTLRNKTTGATIRTSDPGRSLVDGKWSHVATFKGPILRGLAPRAPYFHNGFAANLTEVVHFYDTRFHMGLTSQEINDLVAFLNAT
jgi:cytochrome c peroxidase